MRNQTKRFCHCIKKVARTQKDREKAAIPICIKSVLQKHGRTLKKFKCRNGQKKAFVITQPKKSR